MRIAVDVMGGDHGSAVVIEGVRLALAAQPGITEILLFGQQAEIEAGLKKTRCSDKRVTVVHASEVITMEDKPREAARRSAEARYTWQAAVDRLEHFYRELRLPVPVPAAGESVSPAHSQEANIADAG